MAVPTAILEAARDGDRDRVLAWLDAPDVEETRDVNAVGEGDVSLLMMIASRLDSETSLELARDLVRRGADVNHRAAPPHERRRPGRRPLFAPPERVGLEGTGLLAM